MRLFNKFANWWEEQKRQERIEEEKRLKKMEEFRRMWKKWDDEMELSFMEDFLRNECILIGYLEEEECTLQYCEKLLIENNLVHAYFDWRRNLIIEDGEDYDSLSETEKQMLDEIDEQEEAIIEKIRR